ncbi:hypothetical protein MTO96_021400 [Rhipicephalus appendiculatus]
MGLPASDPDRSSVSGRVKVRQSGNSVLVAPHSSCADTREGAGKAQRAGALQGSLPACPCLRAPIPHTPARVQRSPAFLPPGRGIIKRPFFLGTDLSGGAVGGGHFSRVSGKRRQVAGGKSATGGQQPSLAGDWLMLHGLTARLRFLPSSFASLRVPSCSGCGSI